MKKTIVMMATLLMVSPAFAVSHPKLDVLEIQQQTTVTIPQYCNQFGKMFLDIVLLGMEPGYTVQHGITLVKSYTKAYADNNKFFVPQIYDQFSIEVLPAVPTLTTFKNRFKGKNDLTDRESLWIYDLGFDTCLRSLEAMMLEEK